MSGIAATLVLLMAGSLAPTDQAPLEVRVVAVVDGDTLDIAAEGEKSVVRIELADVDCPELDQPYGQDAKQTVSSLVLGKRVRVRAVVRNRFGQFFARVYLPDGRDLNAELITRGLAWWNSQTSRDEELRSLELQARAQKRGLWSDIEPTSPWDWRYQAASRTLEEAERIPAPRTIPSYSPSSPSQRSRAGCCKICTKGIACGDTCISASKTCRVGPGCACNG